MLFRGAPSLDSIKASVWSSGAAEISGVRVNQPMRMDERIQDVGYGRQKGWRGTLGQGGMGVAGLWVGVSSRQAGSGRGALMVGLFHSQRGKLGSKEPRQKRTHGLWSPDCEQAWPPLRPMYLP